MILQISEDESIILKNLIWDNYQNEKHETVDLQLRLENGHLYVLPNSGGFLKVKGFEYTEDISLKVSREKSIKRDVVKYKGLCIDLILHKALIREKKDDYNKTGKRKPR